MPLPSAVAGRSGGTGRRGGLKIRCPRGRVGSSSHLRHADARAAVAVAALRRRSGRTVAASPLHSPATQRDCPAPSRAPVGPPRRRMSLKLKRNGLFLAGLLVVALALVATGCGGDDGGEAPEALPSSSCTAIEYEGDGDPDYIIASDLPLQGASRTQTLQINDAIRKELDGPRVQGRRLQHRLPGVRRRDCAGRQVGLRQVLAERERLRGERQADRGHRHVQLGLRGDHHPGAEPGTGGRDRDDLARQHVPVPDGQPAGRL